MKNIHRDMMILLKSGITGERIPLADDLCLDAICDIATRQGVLPLLYQGASNCGIPNTQQEMQKMLAHYYRHMVISERQMRAVTQLLEQLENNGIDHMPLKGCNMKLLYPKPELRSMGDADILIRSEQLADCEAIVKSLGYTQKLESDHTNNWISADLYLELHKSVVPQSDADYYAYYGTGWDLAVNRAGHRYDLSPEDTFIFLFTHFARHYRGGGIGCRHVVDLYVYRNAYPQLNEQYLREELHKLHLCEFYENTLRLLDVWFSDSDADEITELMTAFVFSGGSWGTVEAEFYSAELREAVRKGEATGVSVHAALRTIFPPLATIQNRYQILRRYPLLLPVMWVVRWFDVLLFSRRNLKRKLRLMRQIDNETVLTYRQSMKMVGLGFEFV